MENNDRKEIIDEKLNELRDLVRSNAESIQDLIRVTDKMEIHLNQVQKNTEKVEKVHDTLIRREPIVNRLERLEGTTEALQRWKWMILGAAAIMGFVAGMVEPVVSLL